MLSSEPKGDRRSSSLLELHRFRFQLKKLLADRLLVVYLMGVPFALQRIIKDYFYSWRSSNSDKEENQQQEYFWMVSLVVIVHLFVVEIN